MKLYNVPKNTTIKIIETEDILKFYHIDGMYSYCKDVDGNLAHPAAWTEVEIVND